MPWWWDWCLFLTRTLNDCRYHRKCFVSALLDHPALKLDTLTASLFEGSSNIGASRSIHSNHSHITEDADRDDIDDLFDSARALAGLPKLSRGKGKVNTHHTHHPYTTHTSHHQYDN